MDRALSFVAGATAKHVGGARGGQQHLADAVGFGTRRDHDPRREPLLGAAALTHVAGPWVVELGGRAAHGGAGEGREERSARRVRARREEPRARHPVGGVAVETSIARIGDRLPRFCRRLLAPLERERVLQRAIDYASS